MIRSQGHRRTPTVCHKWQVSRGQVDLARPRPRGQGCNQWLMIRAGHCHVVRVRAVRPRRRRQGCERRDASGLTGARDVAMTTLISSVAASTPPRPGVRVRPHICYWYTCVCMGGGGEVLFRVDGETDFVALSRPIFDIRECQQGSLKIN